MWKEESSKRRRKVAAENPTESKEESGERAIALDTNWVVRNFCKRKKYDVSVADVNKGNVQG